MILSILDYQTITLDHLSAVTKHTLRGGGGFRRRIDSEREAERERDYQTISLVDPSLCHD